MAELLRFDAQQQRAGDGNEQPQEGVDVLDTQIDVFITIYRETKHKEITDGARQYRDDGQLPLRDIVFQPCEAV